MEDNVDQARARAMRFEGRIMSPAELATHYRATGFGWALDEGYGPIAAMMANQRVAYGG